METATQIKRATWKVALDATNGDGPGTFEAVLSAPTLDRDGEVIAPKAFDPLPEVLPIHRDHDMTTRGLCAVATPFYDGDVLKAKGTFFEDADGQRMRLYAKHGILKMSVGFMGAKYEVRSGVPHIVKAELLESSFVSVPSNRDTPVTSAKDLGRKSIEGSFEALREQLQRSIRAAGVYAHVVATFTDSVVYEAYDENYDRRTYQASYSFDEAGTLSLGTAEIITVHEVIAPRKSAGSLPAKSQQPDPEASPDVWAARLAGLKLPH